MRMYMCMYLFRRDVYERNRSIKQSFMENENAKKKLDRITVQLSIRFDRDIVESPGRLVQAFALTVILKKCLTLNGRKAVLKSHMCYKKMCRLLRANISAYSNSISYLYLYLPIFSFLSYFLQLFCVYVLPFFFSFFPIYFFLF